MACSETSLQSFGMICTQWARLTLLVCAYTYSLPAGQAGAWEHLGQKLRKGSTDLCKGSASLSQPLHAGGVICC